VLIVDELGGGWTDVAAAGCVGKRMGAGCRREGQAEPCTVDAYALLLISSIDYIWSSNQIMPRQLSMRKTA
jgi:hypothetical protein